MIDRLFFEHPRTVGESYGEHMRVASGFGITMILGGLACLVHALVPGLLVNTASTAIDRLHERMVRNRRRPSATSPDILVGNKAS